MTKMECDCKVVYARKKKPYPNVFKNSVVANQYKEAD